MKINLSKKKSIFLLILAVLLFIIGGFILWEKNREAPYVGGEEFKIEETPAGRVLKNTGMGLIVGIPAEWIMQKERYGVGLYSPEVEFEESGALRFNSLKEGGCVVYIEGRTDPALLSADADYLRMEIQRVKDGEKESKKDHQYSTFLIDEYESLRIDHVKENAVRGITVEIPVGDAVYSLESDFIFSEKCVDEFNKILETVEINK